MKRRQNNILVYLWGLLRHIFRRVNGAWQGVKGRYVSLEKRYVVLRHLWFRVMLIIIAGAIVISPLYAILISSIHNQSYLLTSKELALVSKSTVKTAYIKETANAITYNRADEQSATKGADQAITLAANKADATGKQPYQAALQKDPKKGITFSDSDGARSVTMVPKFSSLGAKLSEGRVIYPNGSSEKQVYSFKANGLKSDILLSSAPDTDTKSYAWQLKLDTTLEARLNSDGSVGVYSADSSLYDNLQVGDDKTQKLIDKARTNGPKNTLVFELPKPFILGANNQTTYDDVSYTLNGDLLTLTARNLKSQSYPLSIDPTITVTTTADFVQNSGDMGNVDTSTTDEIRRSYSAAGTVGTATQQSGIMQTARSNHTSVVYSGYLYNVGGLNSTRRNTIESCALNSGGSVGTCTSVGTFTTARDNFASVVYNGYLYIIGGDDGATSLNDIQRCPLGTGGTVGACTQQASAFTNARRALSAVAYDGYLYIIGGWNGTTYYNDIQSCPIKADGSVGSCNASAGTYTTARANHTSAVYNGYIYIVGGGDATTRNDIQYCPINSGGTVGACTQQLNAFTTQRYDHSTVIYNGYLYISGGYLSGTRYNDVQYCPVNSNGSIGGCTQLATAFTTARSTHTSVAYNGYLYVIGGSDGTTALGDIQRLQISPTLGRASAQSNAFTTARNRFGAAAYDGYMYIFGGYMGSGSPADLNTIYSCPINTNASLGTCSDTGVTLARKTYGFSVTMYHNFIYMSGGMIDGDSNVVPDITRIMINADHSVTRTRQLGIINSGNTDPYLLGSVAYNGYLYLVGGHNDSATGYLNSILYCPISDSDGSLSNCTQTRTFTTKRDRLTTVIYKDYLYIVGGWNGSAAMDDIQSCPINTSNGTVGVCTTQAQHLTKGRIEHTSVLYGNKMYLIGGWDGGGTYYNDVEVCTLGTGGTASGCTSQANAFTTGRYGHAATLHNGNMYILGGLSAGGYLNDAQYIQLGPSHGGAGTKTQSTFTTSRDAHASVAYNGYLYIIAGWNSPTVYGDIQYCPINSDGTVGACAATTSLNIPRYNHTATASNGYIYVVDGLDSSGTNLNNYESCLINSSTHAITSCTSHTGTFKTARNNHASTSYNGRLYIVGGILNGAYQNDVEYCSYAAGGTLTGCDQQLSVFPSARNNLSAEVYNGYLYIIGGFDGTNYRNDIIHCPINGSDGSIGTCIQQLDGLPMNRRSMTTVAYNGYLYIFGGYKNINIVGGTAEDFNDDMQVCPLASNGDVGICNVSMGTLATPLSSQDTVFYDGNAYVSGGSNSVTHYNTVQRIALTQAMPMIARYERVVDTGDAGNTLNAFTINGAASCNYTVSYRTAGSDNIFGSATTVSNVSSGVAQTLNITNKRYILLSATMDDMTCGGQSTITSIIVDYVFPLPPNAPTLTLPANSATGLSVTPEFRLGVTGDTSGNLKYKIDVCSTSNCSSVVRTIDETSSETGWTQIGIVVDKFIVSHVYQLTALSPGTQYWWRAMAIDPLNANLWSSYSSIYSFTTAAVTSAPTFSLPMNGATGVNVRPEFRLGVTGDTSGNLKYKIDVCSTSNCSSVVRTIDETASETGWTSLGNVSGTVIMSHTYLPAALNSSTQYWFRGQAMDPGGANQWSAYSSILSFTTGVVNAQGQIVVNQNTKLYSGTTLKTGN